MKRKNIIEKGVFQLLSKKGNPNVIIKHCITEKVINPRINFQLIPSFVNS